MARSTRQPPPTKTNEGVEELLEAVLEDVLQTAAMPSADWRRIWQDPFTPMAIPVEHNREYHCTQAGANAAHKIADLSWSSRRDYRETLSRKAFDRLSFEAVGRTIADCKAHIPADQAEGDTDDAFYAAMAADYRRHLDALAARTQRDLTHHIQCHLFHTDQNVPGFAIGPVRFLPRNDWIAQHAQSRKQFTLVQDVESGMVPASELRTRARQEGASDDVVKAWDTLSFLGPYSWVATIEVQGHEPRRSYEKASTIVGLAIDLLGLRFRRDDARHFVKAGWGHLFGEIRLAQDAGGRSLFGWSSPMPGLGSKPGALTAKVQAEQLFLDAAGEVLSAYLAARAKGDEADLLQRWANALYWYGEARREASDFMAVVDYGCAADGLSGAGGNYGKIVKFAEAALRPKAQVTAPGRLSVKQAVEKVYAEGRNKLAHGEEPGLFQDQSETRLIGDTLMTLLLIELTEALADVLKNRPQFLRVFGKNGYRVLMARLASRA